MRTQATPEDRRPAKGVHRMMLAAAVVLTAASCGYTSDYLPQADHRAWHVVRVGREVVILQQMPFETIRLKRGFECTEEDLAAATRPFEGDVPWTAKVWKLEESRVTANIVAAPVFRVTDGKLESRAERLVVLLDEDSSTAPTRSTQNVVRFYNDLLECKSRLEMEP